MHWIYSSIDFFREVMLGRGPPLMNVTTESSHELGNGSNLCHTCILHLFFGCTLQMKINASNARNTHKRARWSHEKKLFLIGHLKDFNVPGYRTQNAWSKETWTNIVSRLNAKFGTSYSLSKSNRMGRT
jgi:hypothetical protein